MRALVGGLGAKLSALRHLGQAGHRAPTGLQGQNAHGVSVGERGDRGISRRAVVQVTVSQQSHQGGMRVAAADDTTTEEASQTALTVDMWVQRAQAGDERAFQALFESHRAQVQRLVFRMLGGSPDVEDVVQDVFVHVYRSLSRFRGDSKFSTWLYRLTVNVTKMHLRRGRSRPQTVDAPVPETPSASRAAAEAPDAMVERNARVRALQGLLDNLSEKKRTVLVLHDFEGMQAKDIAEVIDTPVLTVRTRLFYARKELYEAIAEDPKLRQSVEAILDTLPGQSRKTRRKPSADSKASDDHGGASNANGANDNADASDNVDAAVHRSGVTARERVDEREPLGDDSPQAAASGNVVRGRRG